MFANLIEFIINHYVLSGMFAVLLVLLIVTEMRKGGQSLSSRELTALVNSDKGVAVERLVAVMDNLRQGGFFSVSIATRKL